MDSYSSNNQIPSQVDPDQAGWVLGEEALSAAKQRMGLMEDVFEAPAPKPKKKTTTRKRRPGSAPRKN